MTSTGLSVDPAAWTVAEDPSPAGNRRFAQPFFHPRDFPSPAPRGYAALVARADVAVVGGGIVGLATARSLVSRVPGVSIVVLDKETRLAAHQSGRNSGVIHSGLYYKPGSLKARMAVAGAREMERFAEEHGIPYERCGKLVVATREEELPALDALHERGEANGVPNRRIGVEELREREPHCAGITALHVPSTGIIDYTEVCRTLGGIVEEGGGRLELGREVVAMRNVGGEMVLSTEAEEYRVRTVVNCAGLQCDRVARMTGRDPRLRIVPFRGEYWEIVPERRDLVRDLIYPVPDPSFPFLGVHFTRTIGGGLECGPNAVLALAREGYTWREIDLGDLAEIVGYSGFRSLARRYWKTGAGEVLRSLSKHAFVRALQRLVPEVEVSDLMRVPAGIRAQALAPDGGLVDDFAIEIDGPVVDVLNAPSPAATASLLIGDHVAGIVQDRMAA